MNQGRKSNQIETSNKMMATFLIAMGAFILLTYGFNLIQSKSEWLKKVERQLVTKNF